MIRGPWRERARRGAVAAVRLLVMGAAIAFLARGVAWGDVAKTLRAASLPLLALVTALNAIMMVVKSERLRLLLGRRPTLRATFLTKLTTSAINNVTPFRGGDVARIWMLQRHAGISKSVAAVVALVEHLFDLCALSILALFGARFAPGQRWAEVAAPIVLGSVVLLFALLGWSGRRAGRAEAAPEPDSPAGGWADRLRGLRVRLAPGLRVLREPGTMLAAHALSFAGWGLEAVMIVLTARAIGLPVSLPLAIVVLLGINAAMALPSAPASAGAFEAGVTLVLLAAGASKGPAVALALLYHLVQIVPVTLAGAVVVFRVGFTLGGLPTREPPRAEATSAIS